MTAPTEAASSSAGMTTPTITRARPASPERPPAPPPAARSARGTASRRRSRARRAWQNSTDGGSPPCSPQMPTLRSGPRARARARPPSAPAGPRPPGRCDTNGSLRQDLLVDVLGQELAGVVAREAEGHLRQVVGAEGEELRLARRSRPAVSAARGTSIMVPTRYSTRHAAPSRMTSSATRRTTAAWSLRARSTCPTSGIMISGTTFMPFAATSHGGLEDGARLHRGDLGIGDAEAAAAVPEHGVELVQLLDAVRAASGRPFLSSRHGHPVPLAPSSFFCGRRSPAAAARCPPSAPRAWAGTRAAADRACGW